MNVCTINNKTAKEQRQTKQRLAKSITKATATKSTNLRRHMYTCMYLCTCTYMYINIFGTITKDFKYATTPNNAYEMQNISKELTKNRSA